jgi:tRNA threonylcarbamoyladenosine biosynthesis protein TsaB
LILALETSTKGCSVALLHKGIILAEEFEVSDQYVHSEKLHLFIERVLAAAKIKPKDLSAVAVGKGPGSYTGLRIGVSAAKGLCYALNIPLLSANGPEILMQQAPLNLAVLPEKQLFIPMIDARRQEVYCAVYQHQQKLKNIEALVVEAHSFEGYEKQYAQIHLFGDGADKFTTLFEKHSKITVHPNRQIHARHLALLAEKKLVAQETEDVAYFEPFYLKDFVALKPKRSFF